MGPVRNAKRTQKWHMKNAQGERAAQISTSLLVQASPMEYLTLVLGNVEHCAAAVPGCQQHRAAALRGDRELRHRGFQQPIHYAWWHHGPQQRLIILALHSAQSQCTWTVSHRAWIWTVDRDMDIGWHHGPQQRLVVLALHPAKSQCTLTVSHRAWIWTIDRDMDIRWHHGPQQ
eukprot:1153245-Pelagomonas_calceolata.AAC.1